MLTKRNKIKFIHNNLVDEIKREKRSPLSPFFSLNKDIVGQAIIQKLIKFLNILKKTNLIIYL